ncbi:MAG TPA: MgtC/SapB family protein, partial [Spirochaetota bacterium]|nr:MgtC/SapB family protein [Spirochaetota bacterium]
MNFIEPLNLFIKYTPTLLMDTAVAIICGAIIGIQRERKGKPAGYRTMVLICVGSSLFTFISGIIPQIVGTGISDPTRIAAQIVTGIGFVGAGTIIQARGNIMGLTSAAVIWLVGAIGMLIGFGFPLASLILTLVILIFLMTSYKVESLLLGKCHFTELQVTFKDSGSLKKTISSILINNDFDISKYKLESKGKELFLK